MRKTILAGILVLALGPISAHAITYNYLAQGADFRFEGMFDCAVALSLCDETTLTNWMFVQRGGVFNRNLGISEDQGGDLALFNPNTGELRVTNTLVSIDNPMINMNVSSIDLISTSIAAGDRTSFQSFTITRKNVPAPATLALLGLGLLGVGYRRRQRS